MSDSLTAGTLVGNLDGIKPRGVGKLLSSVNTVDGAGLGSIVGSIVDVGVVVAIGVAVGISDGAELDSLVSSTVGDGVDIADGARLGSLVGSTVGRLTRRLYRGCHRWFRSRVP